MIWFQIIRGKINEVFDWVKTLHGYRNDTLVERYSIPIYQNFFNVFMTFKKLFTLLISFDTISMTLLPLAIPGVDYTMPIEIYFKQNTDNDTGIFILNYVFQMILIADGIIFFSVLLLIFFIASFHLLNELKLIKVLCKKIGLHEEFEIIKSLRESKQRSKNNQNNSVQQEDDDLMEALWEVNLDSENDFEPSSEILKSIINLHSNIFESLDRINFIFSSPIMIFEGQIVLTNCMVVVMLLVDRTRIIYFAIVNILVTFIYLLMSVISSVVKSGFEDVLTSLYTSKWYCLKIKDRKILNQILEMSQKPKALNVGFLSECNLDRFTNVMKFIYNTCLMIKFFVEKNMKP
uniref:Odorant receptor n=1 Tax=Culicoides sonorensis TaxID=179676 RepID=A0A336LY69_CULSO